MRISLIIFAIIGAALIYFATISNHPMAHDFLSRVVFELGYKVAVVVVFYGLARWVTGIRRHEIIAISNGVGSKGHLAIYIGTIVCIALILSFVS